MLFSNTSKSKSKYEKYFIFFSVVQLLGRTSKGQMDTKKGRKGQKTEGGPEKEDTLKAGSRDVGPKNIRRCQTKLMTLFLTSDSEN